ncbi:MAG TPA: collagen-like protein [Solirubrobacterales bacterium]
MPPRIEVSRSLAIWTLIGVCALSAAIGSGIALLAETGPAGAKGERGAPGPRGPEGPEGAVDIPDLGFVESELEDLRDELSSARELESRVDAIDSDLTETEETVSELCFELDDFC